MYLFTILLSFGELAIGLDLLVYHILPYWSLVTYTQLIQLGVGRDVSGCITQCVYTLLSNDPIGSCESFKQVDYNPKQTPGNFIKASRTNDGSMG